MMQLKLLRSKFDDYMTQESDSWRSGKGLVKLRKIDDSLAEDRSEFQKVQLMVKREVMAQAFHRAKPIKKARGIQFTTNERSAYEFAQEYYGFSAALVEVSQQTVTYGGVDFLVTYSAKMSHDEISQFASESEALRPRYACSVIDERDGINWDANIQVAHRVALIFIYAILSAALAKHASSGVSVQGKYRSKTNTKISYKVKGSVKSGHPDTSSGNGALNREISIQAIASLPAHLKPRLVRALVMGDDYIAWLYFDRPVDFRELKDALNTAERKLGIDPSRGLFSDVRCASFISLGFYIDNLGKVVALPKIGRLLYRLFWTVTPLHGRDPRRLASGIAASFYPLYCTFPPMRQFLRHHMQAPPLDVSDYNHYYLWDEIGSKRLAAPINWAANHLVKYGSLPLVMSIELPDTQTAGLIHDHIVDHMYAVDVADPSDRPGCVA